MKKLILISLVSLVFTINQKEKPKILIIGDSISIGYTPFVASQLEEIADVKHNPGNAQHTGTGLKKIENWLGSENWDIIQFNWGLWDLCYRNPDSDVQGNRDKVNGEITFNITDYASNLDSIVSMLKKKSNAKLIFVTTSYVPKGEAGRFELDAIRYNKVAKKIMNKHLIEVNDIYEVSKQIHSNHAKNHDDVHYTKEGYQKLALVISEFLKRRLKN